MQSLAPLSESYLDLGAANSLGDLIERITAYADSRGLADHKEAIDLLCDGDWRAIATFDVRLDAAVMREHPGAIYVSHDRSDLLVLERDRRNVWRMEEYSFDRSHVVPNCGRCR